MKIDHLERLSILSKLARNRSAVSGIAHFDPSLLLPEVGQIGKVFIDYRHKPQNIAEQGKFLDSTLVQIRFFEDKKTVHSHILVASIGACSDGEIDYVSLSQKDSSSKLGFHSTDAYSMAYAFSKNLEYDPLRFQSYSDLLDESLDSASKVTLLPASPPVVFRNSGGPSRN